MKIKRVLKANWQFRYILKKLPKKPKNIEIRYNLNVFIRYNTYNYDVQNCNDYIQSNIKLRTNEIT